jgi:carbamoylphosphate synthase large subunit
MPSQPLTVLCVATYEKGQDFMRECKDQGCRVLLLTMDKLRFADWPHEAIDDYFYLPQNYVLDDVIKGVSYVARTHRIDRIVALDDFDVETGAALREHLRMPGMGDTTARYFRDKLAMRVKARDNGFLVPEFVHALNYDALRDYMARVPAPWVLKPRSEASATGIRKVHNADALWPILEDLGDKQSFYVLEKYIAGDVYHIDSFVWNRNVIFSVSHKYGAPPMNVAHEGGVFMTRRINPKSADARALKNLNRTLTKELGLVRGVTHTEFIKGRDDGRFYFLETGARVGGANIAEVVEAATGLNPWREWAKIEIAGETDEYQLPPHREDYAGIVVSLARQEWPDTSAYNDPEVVWRMNKRHHAGLIVAAPDEHRVEDLLQQYVNRFVTDFMAVQPLPDKPTS